MEIADVTFNEEMIIKEKFIEQVLVKLNFGNYDDHTDREEHEVQQ